MGKHSFLVAGVLIDRAGGYRVDGVGDDLPQEPRAKEDGDAEDDMHNVAFGCLELVRVASRHHKHKTRVDKKEHRYGRTDGEEDREELFNKAADRADIQRVYKAEG